MLSNFKPCRMPCDHEDYSLMDGERFSHYLNRLVLFNDPLEIRLGRREWKLLSEYIKDEYEWTDKHKVSLVQLCSAVTWHTPILAVNEESHLSVVTPEGIL